MTAQLDTPSVMVVVPTYNEVETLPVLLAELARLQVPGLRAVVVDDSSPDGTGDLADELSRGGLLDVIHRQTKEGLGRAYVAGMTHAIESGAQIIVQMDADLSHPVARLPALVCALEGASLAIGSRYTQGGSIDSTWPWSRRLLSRGANTYLNALLRVGIRDLTGGFKAWRADALTAIDLPTIASRGYAFQIEANFRAARLGLPIVEVPIRFTDRTRGHSKLTVAVQLEAAALPWRLRRQSFTAAPPRLAQLAQSQP